MLRSSIARLKNVSKEYAGIIESNNNLLNEDPTLLNMRKSMSNENINKMMVEAAKKDSKLAEHLTSMGGRLLKVKSSTIASYNMGTIDSQSNLKTEQIKLLHSKIELLYHNLWAVILRLSQLPKFKNFKPKGVRDVRNHLMDHTDNPQTSGAYIYSFGVSTYGPVLRPLKPTGVKAPNDKGLEANIEEFLSSIIKILY